MIEELNIMLQIFSDNTMKNIGAHNSTNMNKTKINNVMKN